MDPLIPTRFAPAERLADELIIEQATRINDASPIPALFNMLPYVVLILNKERQIIYSNHSLFEALGIHDAGQVIGLRFGEALRCIHTDPASGGCGTTECCSVCGAVRAILESQRTRTLVSKECHVTLDRAGNPSLDLQIYASPIGDLQQEYTLFVVKDIGEEKRKQVFERVFFHDLLNTSGAVRGLIELLQTTENPEEIREICGIAQQGMEMLIEEIVSQKELIAAESGDLALKVAPFSADAMLTKLVNHFRNDPRTSCALRFDPHSPETVIQSDPTLVRRVVQNMAKNAVEASRAGDVVTIGYTLDEGAILFRVRNPQVMSREAQLQIFQRSYSTKGAGRGIGTYSMKLLGERLLGGQVSFSSDDAHGTEFRFRLPLK
ncbi:histidine kinase/DNA gyrase B/HSP90-like ATPase [Hydrogenispora ethanolica]|jgi:signal transduction histidine kinase|uniref:Histidine kinase/DNA gyrase B/HSP90-like ATPase n=1 Tax=Hydrogenispora ethanolica TaxID=1082276 RepID=A0A4V6NH67_HYDET|nr:ATP-binding protein [Hydrogenispora ethanolica]TCL76357.1 histidine kinase/DNA gyrase B/HSP90-like ATPase [Hydrogenispora ethanolica]